MRALPIGQRPVLLELDLTQAPVIPDPNDPLERLANRSRAQLPSVLRALHEAGADNRVAGLIVKLGGSLHTAVAAELRLGLLAFAASGKPTLGWAEDLGPGGGATVSMTLGSALGELWLQPGGSVGPLGVALETTFVRRALDRLGVLPQLQQRHEFKNAADILTRTSYTDAHRQALEGIVGSLFDEVVEAISTGRQLSIEQVRAVVDRGPLSAEQAMQAGLIDAVGIRDQAYAAIRARVGRPVELLLADRWRRPRRFPALPARRRRHVAVVEVRGAITGGRSRNSPLGRMAGSDTVAGALRAAARSEHAGAVVMWVDSPGGSAIASEVIWREVTRLREAGKPVVVAMGELAASGGYYVACPADVIVALPSTLTGSIGVIGGKLVAAGLLDRLGLTFDHVSQGEHALMNSAREPFTEEQSQLLAAELDRIYADFVAKVAQGRGMTAEQVESVARGRVWTGRDALGIGLVDELGGLRQAIRIARRAGGLPADAPALPAVVLTPMGRLGRPRNSDDPRAVVTIGLPGLRDGLADGISTLAATAPKDRLRRPR